LEKHHSEGVKWNSRQPSRLIDWVNPPQTIGDHGIFPIGMMHAGRFAAVKAWLQLQLVSTTVVQLQDSTKSTHQG
jgi:hypothetical protein